MLYIPAKKNNLIKFKNISEIIVGKNILYTYMLFNTFFLVLKSINIHRYLNNEDSKKFVLCTKFRVRYSVSK
jgi:hypothetical protein